MAIKLVKGDFNSLEEALLAQIKLMQDRIEELEKWEKHCYHCGRHWTECCYEYRGTKKTNHRGAVEALQDARLCL